MTQQPDNETMLTPAMRLDAEFYMLYKAAGHERMNGGGPIPEDLRARIHAYVWGKEDTPDPLEDIATKSDQ